MKQISTSLIPIHIAINERKEIYQVLSRHQALDIQKGTKNLCADGNDICAHHIIKKYW